MTDFAWKLVKSFGEVGGTPNVLATSATLRNRESPTGNNAFTALAQTANDEYHCRLVRVGNPLATLRADLLNHDRCVVEHAG